MTRPVPANWEAITTHSEGGWLAPGRCGGWHLVGGGWSWWRCPICKLLKRYEARQALTAKQDAELAHFYPNDEEPA